MQSGAPTQDEQTALRAALAQDVMGWTEATVPWAYSDAARVWTNPTGETLLTCHAWRPDEDHRQSDTLVERMIMLGFTLHLDIDTNGCKARFERNGQRTHASARTQPQAIANAARRAIETI